jgi:hypothetical protein
MKILSLPEGPLPGGIGWQHFALGCLPVLVEQVAHRIFRHRYSRYDTAWISCLAGLAVTVFVADNAPFHLWIKCIGLYLTYYTMAASFRKDDLDQLLYLDQKSSTLAPIYDEIIKLVSKGLTLQQIERFLRQNNSNTYLIPQNRPNNFDATPFRLPNSPTEKTFYLALSYVAPGIYTYNFSLLNETGFICDPATNVPMDSDAHYEQENQQLLAFLNAPRPQLPKSSEVD